MTERLARMPPELSAYVDRLRQPDTGAGAQRLELQAGRSALSSGDDDVTEWTSVLSYSLVAGRVALTATTGPIRFDSGDTLAIAGMAPLDVHLEYGVSSRDSLRVQVRTPSLPQSLTSAEVSALASIGTSAADLASVQFGTPMLLGLGYTRAGSISPSLRWSAQIGGEYEPRPGGGEWTYWRGTTLRAGVHVADTVGPTLTGVALSATRSFADSLSGRNLFFGGGTLQVSAQGARYVSGDALVGVSASYLHPYSTQDAAASRRRVPVGDFTGAAAVGAFPVKGSLVVPAVVLSREWSEMVTSTGVVKGTGWAFSTSLAVDLGLSRSLALTPEAGYTFGSVGLDVVTSLGTTPTGQPITTTVGTSDRLTGWWMSVRSSASF